MGTSPELDRFFGRVAKLAERFSGSSMLQIKDIPLRSFVVYEAPRSESIVTAEYAITAEEYPIACAYLASVLDYGIERFKITDEFVARIADFFGSANWSEAFTGHPRYRFILAMHYGSFIGSMVWQDHSSSGAS